MFDQADAPSVRERPLLSAQDVFRLASLDLRARVIAEGLLVGTHRSRRLGSSTEFAEHKLYVPGDDVKRIDWRTYARTDRYFVRRYEEENQLDVYLITDTSASMRYAGGARGSYHVSKLTFAKTLAAALAWVTLRQRDAVSLTLFADEQVLFVPPQARPDHLQRLMAELERIEAKGTTQTAPVVSMLAQRVKRRSLIVLFSDLLDVADDLMQRLGEMRQRGSDVIVLHTLDPDELEFPYDGVVRFEDLEGERVVQVDAPGVRTAYLAEVKRFLERHRTEAARHDLRYVLARTDESPVLLLRRALGGASEKRGG